MALLAVDYNNFLSSTTFHIPDYERNGVMEAENRYDSAEIVIIGSCAEVLWSEAKLVYR